MAVNVTWKQGLALPHDPDDVADLVMDFSAVVGEDDALDSSDISSTGVSAALLTETEAGVITFRVSGGEVAETAFVTVQAIMTSGRKQSRTVNFNVLER